MAHRPISWTGAHDAVPKLAFGRLVPGLVVRSPCVLLTAAIPSSNRARVPNNPKQNAMLWQSCGKGAGWVSLCHEAAKGNNLGDQLKKEAPYRVAVLAGCGIHPPCWHRLDHLPSSGRQQSRLIAHGSVALGTLCTIELTGAVSRHSGHDPFIGGFFFAALCGVLSPSPSLSPLPLPPSLMSPLALYARIHLDKGRFSVRRRPPLHLVFGSCPVDFHPPLPNLSHVQKGNV